MSAAEAYLAVRTLHIACAVVSIGGFAVRGALMLADSPGLQKRFVRIAPHVVDMLLLASAIWLAWFLGQIPFVHGWITAKVAALKCRVYEVGITYHGRTYEEGKKIGWKDGVSAFRCIVKYNLRGKLLR